MADVLPNIFVNLNQVKSPLANTYVPFNVTVFLKAKTGPIGEFIKLSSYNQAVKTFGLGDATTPALYGIEQVLKTYSYINVVRLASSSAAVGTIALKAHDSEGAEIAALGTIIDGTSDYKTDIYNGDEIKFLYNSVNTRLALTGELDGTTYTTPYEIIDISTATAVDEEAVLNKLVSNWNQLGTGITLTNKFVNKTTEDDKIESDAVSGTVTSGDSGFTGITDADVISSFDVIEKDPTLEIQDAIIVPEFRSVAVVNAGLALRNKYFFIGTAVGNDLDAKLSYLANLKATDQGVLYIPDSCTLADTSITVPFEIAAIYAWAKSYSVSRYLAPAGVNRTTLDIVSNVLNNLSDADAEILYNYDIPVNPVKYLTNHGFTLYGQKTMDASQVFTNRINVSGLVQFITIHSRELLIPYLFEYTPVSTFQKVFLDMDKLFQSLVTQEVLYDDYQIVCDSSNNTPETLANHELHVALALRPVNVTEYIYLDLTVTDDLGGDR